MIFVLDHRGNFNDVRMRQNPAYVRLVKQQLAVLGAMNVLRQQELHGKMAVADQLDDLPHLAGMPRRKQVLQAVSTDLVLGDGELLLVLVAPYHEIQCGDQPRNQHDSPANGPGQLLPVLIPRRLYLSFAKSLSLGK